MGWISILVADLGVDCDLGVKLGFYEELWLDIEL
jgi:hypothetical protein